MIFILCFILIFWIFKSMSCVLFLIFFLLFKSWCFEPKNIGDVDRYLVMTLRFLSSFFLLHRLNYI